MENHQPVRGGGRGLEFQAPIIGEPGYGKSVDGIDAKATNIVVLSCDFGKTFDNLRSSAGSKFIYADPGEDGYTADVRTVDLQARVMTDMFARGGSAENARDAAQKIFDENPYKLPLDGEKMILNTIRP
jgi:hypothetical protein